MQKNVFLLVAAVITFGLVCLAEAEYNCEYKKDGFYSDDDFCHVYWRCNYGVAEEYECPAGTAWNHLEMRCDWLDNVDCTRVKEKPDKKDDDDNEDKEADETTKKAKKSTRLTSETDDTTSSTTSETVDDLHDTKLEQNESNITVVEQRDTSGLWELLKSLKAIIVSNSDEASGYSNSSESNATDEFDYNELCGDNRTTATAFREDPFICNRYIRCNHGYAQKFKCFKGTAWDLERKICMWAEYVNCDSRVYVTDEELLGDNDSDEKVKHNVTRTTTLKTTTLACI